MRRSDAAPSSMQNTEQAVNEADGLKGLRSHLPSARARAAEWFLSNATESHAPLLTRAIEVESVPNIKRLLVLAVTRARGVTSPLSAADSDSAAEHEIFAEILDSLSGLIRHETEPVIGWLRRSAASDIGESYETSNTFKNIELLRRRLRGLEALAAAHRLPTWTRTSITELVRECRPPDLPLASIVAPTSNDDVIDTDIGLFSIIVSNALLNAWEASPKGDEVTVRVESGVTDLDFWISIANRFDGHAFELDHVLHTGASTKSSHKGLGLSAMTLAAKRLDYEISLNAAGGTAVFSLRGRRFNA